MNKCEIGSAGAGKRSGLPGWGALATSASVTALLATISASPAHATCIVTGNDIVCTGANAAHTYFGDGLTATIDQNATVTSVGGAFSIQGAGSTVTNNGTISTTNGSGVAALSLVQSGLSGAGDLTFTNNGNVEANGPTTRGVFMNNGGGGATLANAAGALIQSSGQGSFGAVIQSLDAGAVVNSGTIRARGDNATAVAMFGPNTGSRTLSLTNTGTIEATQLATSDDSRVGVRIQNVTGDISVHNQDGGVIRGGGAGGRGVDLLSTMQSNIVLTNDEVIEARGLNAIGVRMHNQDGDLVLNNNLNIFGLDQAASAVYMQNDGAGELQVNQGAAGAITGSGTALTILKGSGPAVINNAGSIAVANGGMAIYFEELSTGSGTSLVVNNTGLLQAAGGTTLRVRMANAGSSAEINNTGNINGSMDFQGGSATIINRGNLFGNVIFGAGDDTFEMRSGAQLTGNVNGGAGTDIFRFFNPQDVTGTGRAYTHAHNLVNFERVTVSNMDLTLNGATIGNTTGGSFEVASDSSLTARGASVTISNPGGAFTNDGSVRIGSSTVLNVVNGDYAAQDGSVTVFEVDTGAGYMEVGGNAIFETGSTIELDVLDFDTLINGRTIDAVAAWGTVTDASGNVVDNSALFDFDKQIVSVGGQSVLRITARQLLMLQDAVNAGDPAAVAAATQLQAIVDAAGPAGVRFSTTLGQIQNAGDLEDALRPFWLDNSNGIMLAQLGGIDGLIDRARSQSLARTGNEHGIVVWGDVGSSRESLDRDGFFNGYDGSGQTISAGLEAPVVPGLRAGLAVEFGDGKVRYDVSQPGKAEIESRRVAVYASGRVEGLRFDAIAGVGNADIATQRAIPVLDEAARGSTTGDAWFVQAGLGYEMGDGSLRFHPNASLRYADLSLDGYVETASDAALRVSERDLDSMRGQIGVDVLYSPDDAAPLPWSLSGHAGITHDFNDLGGMAEVQFAAGGSRFGVQQQTPSKTAFVVGAQADISLGNSLDLTIAVGSESGDGRSRQTAHIGLSTRF